VNPKKSSKKSEHKEITLDVEDPAYIQPMSAQYVGNFKPWKWERLMVNLKDYSYERQISFEANPMLWFCIERGQLTLPKYLKQDEIEIMKEWISKGPSTKIVKQ